MAFNLGSALGGAVSGFKTGLDLKDMVNKAKMNKATAEAIGEAQAQAKSHDNTYKIDATVPTSNANSLIKTRDLANSASNTDTTKLVADSNSPTFGERLSKAIKDTPNIGLGTQQEAQVRYIEAPKDTSDTTQTNYNLLASTPKQEYIPAQNMYADGGRVDASSLGLDTASIMNAGQAQPVQPTEPLQQSPQQAALQPLQATSQPVSQPTQAPQGLDATQAQQVQNPVQQAPTPRQREAYYSRAAIDKNLYDKLTDTAVKYGDGKAALQYFKASFDTSQNMIKDNLKYAQQEFEQAGDLTAYKDLYNHAYPDGRQILDVGRDDKGNYLIKSQGTNGKQLDATYSSEQIKGMLLHFGDTEGLWKAQAATAVERQKEINKTDDEIRKGRVNPQKLGLGEKLIVDGKEIANNPKAAGGLDNIFDAQLAAVDPNLPPQERAKQVLKNQQAYDIEKARASKADSEVSFERQAYDDWSREPANKGKGKNQYLKEKANWKNNEGGLDSVTTSTERTDAKTLEVTKESRTTHEPKTKPVSAAYQNYLDAYKKAEGHPEVQKKITAIYTGKK